MKALLEFKKSPETWVFEDQRVLREAVLLLRDKGIVSIPGFSHRQVLTSLSKLPSEKTRALLSSFFQEVPFTSKSVRPDALGLVVTGPDLEKELSPEIIWDLVGSIREYVDRGPRENEYKETLKKLSDPTERIQIVDPYLATAIANSPRDLWLLDKLVNDFHADIQLVSRPVFGSGRTDLDKSTGQVLDFLKNRYVSRLNTGQAVNLIILQPTRTTDFHDREITFFFESGFASFALGMGIKRFGYDPISGPDCHPMPRAMALSKRLARKQMREISSHTFTGA